MENRVPFGFVTKDEQEINSYIVQDGIVDVLNYSRHKWERLSDYPFPVQYFWEQIANCIEQDGKLRMEHKLIRNDFECPTIPVAELVDELVCRDIPEERIDLLMDRRVYNRLAYRTALGFQDIGTHHEMMRAKQALLFNGAYFRVGFSKVLPKFQIAYDRAGKIQIIVVTSNQVKIEFPIWCESGRYDIHSR